MDQISSSFYRASPPPPAGESSRMLGEQQSMQISRSHAGQHVMMLADPGTTDEFKLKAAQELSENFELIIVQPQYPAFLDLAIKTFIKILQDGEVHFIAENSMQQVRKLILEMIHRLPTNDYLRPHAKSILALMLKLLGTENEENVLVCLRIIIELHKQYKPQFNPEIPKFLSFVKNIYRELPNHMHKILERRPAIKVNDISDVNIKALLGETFTVTLIQRERKSAEDATIVYNLIPKATTSLQVLQELPVIVVFMFQLYKDYVHQDVAEFIPLIMATITLQPTAAQRGNPNFNKEIYVDFVGAQIKTLSFLAYIIKYYQEIVTQHSTYMVKGVLGLLTVCPPEVTHLRKELLVAARHILSTELHVKFVPYMEKLFDKNVLLGRGWTTHESLRPFAYSTLAEFVHQVRDTLPLSDLTRAVHLFAMNVHDETLPTNIQTMSCKLLVNLVDCISEKENGSGRELLLRMLEVKQPQAAVLNAAGAVAHPTTSISTLLKLATNPAQGTAASATTPSATVNTPFTPLISSLPSMPGTLPSSAGLLGTTVGITGLTAGSTLLASASGGPASVQPGQGNVPKEEKSRFGFPVSQANTYSVTDCRNMVKTLVGGVKTISWSCCGCKGPGADSQGPSRIFQPKEVRLFIRLVKWAMKAFDIYSLTVNPLMPGVVVASPPRASNEPDVLKRFAAVFTKMHPQNFQEIFQHSIEYIVNSISRNLALQVLANFFLEPLEPNTSTSPIFATILLEYLLERMDEIGNNTEKSNLYLKLFKIVFGNVAEYPVENEHMLRPHLHKIVNRSMELAMTAKDPYIYFLLLRALFHSIGGGKHDLLYQEFLPLLPNLLQGLNTLQSGLHKQHMKDLFVELCLTVPVRLSSLLPYLSMLMEPLVSALNGSRTLNCQGLQTLELCVNNLSLDHFYEYIQPVRAELMQALWRIVSNPLDQLSHVAFRVLGKFGGGNRKMMTEPQKLNYSTKYSPGPCIPVYFVDQQKPIEFPVEKVIETAYNALKTSSTDPEYRKQSWEVIRCFLIASLDLSETKNDIQQFFSHPSFSDAAEKIAPIQGIPYKMPDKQSRQTHQTAVTAMFVAFTIKELTKNVLPTFAFIVSHYTMLAIAQQAVGKQANQHGMDALVLIDALAVIMGHEEKELCKSGHLAMMFLLKTASNILGSEERACRLLIMEYLAERMCSLCYDSAWYAKLGGCIAIKFMFERMPLRWVFEHLFLFLKSLLFVMMDLTGEVSGGAIDMAKTNLKRLLSLCAAPIDRDKSNESLYNVQQKCLYEVTYELMRRVTSPNTLLREQAKQSLEVLAEIQGKTVTEIMEPHKAILQDMIPPVKHLLCHQPANVQIGIMDGNTFCTTLEPRLFTINLAIAKHESFFNELKSLCEAEDAALKRLSCYKAIPSLIPLRKAAYRVLAACHYIESRREQIFNVLYGALEKNNPEIQEAGLECMKKFISGFQIDMAMVHAVMRPLLCTLGDYRNLTLNGTKRLSYLTMLFPASFKEVFLEQLLQHLIKLLEISIVSHKTSQQVGLRYGENEKKIETIISIFYHLPSISGKFLESVCRLVLQTEKRLMIETSSPFREPLMKYLLKFPQETVDLFLNDNNVKDQQWSSFLEYIIKHEEGKVLHEYIQRSTARLTTLALAKTQNQTATPAEKAEMQYMSIRITSIMIKYDDIWLSSQHQLVKAYKNLWMDDTYLEPHKKLEAVEAPHWKEPKLLVRVLLHYFCHHPNDIDLLFQLLRALCDCFIPDFQFLRDFLENTVSQNYTVEWKRTAFFRFIEHFQSTNMSQDLKAKILQLILIPCFAVSFEKGEGEKLIGTPSTPEQPNPENCVSVFISKAIDPDNPFANSDAVRIFLLQFSCLLLEQASSQIKNAANKRQDTKVQRLFLFASPGLLGKKCVDPTTRYHGHLLLCHIISKFTVHKRIKEQVFQSLLKAHAFEARTVVRQALDIITPLIPVCMEDGYTILTHWTKKIIVEEGHSMQQLFHMLQLVVRHYKVYFPVRHYLVQYMVSSMRRLCFSPNATMEHRKLAVELTEVIIKWDLQRIKDEAEAAENSTPGVNGKRPSTDESGTNVKKRRSTILSGHSLVPAMVPEVEPDYTTPIDKLHSEAVLNFLLRLACQVHDKGTTLGSPGELLSKRCVALLKTALKSDMWPYAGELKLNWLDKMFMSAEGSSPNFGNICTALELLTYLLGIMKREDILMSIKPLQRGLAACIASSNSKVIRLVHGLMTLLMGIFPPESTTASVASKYEELKCLYTSLGEFISECLASYEKNAKASPTSLYGPLMMLKAACLNNQTYIDRFIIPFMRVLQRMTREHLNPAHKDQPSSCELLILSLDLVKNRVVVMSADMRKNFIGSILVGLIEKTQEIKVMKAICKMLKDWMENKNPIAINQTPTLREKSILLVKMMQHFDNTMEKRNNLDKRFPDDLELHAQFLDIINFIYRDETLKKSELATKLEPAFLQGLRCIQPSIRAKFFEIFDSRMERRLHDRLLYIMVQQNWEPMGPHYWIKQCIELIVVTARPEDNIRICGEGNLMPPITAVLKTADPVEKISFQLALVNVKDKENRKASLQQLIEGHSEYVESIQNTRTIDFLLAMAQLCHMEKTLAERNIVADLVPFLSSGAHVIQKDCQPSSLNTFVEALTLCDNPPISIKPTLMKYIGKSHNLWHRMTLKLEQLIHDAGSSHHKRHEDCYDFEPSSTLHKVQEVVDNLSDMYQSLREEDMWCGLWQKHARYVETTVAIAYETQGFFEQAQTAYEVAMSKIRGDAGSSAVTPLIHAEMKMWEERWIRCSKELNQWSLLLEYGADENTPNPFLVLESAWRVPNWPQMHEALTQIEHNCPKELMWKMNLYKGYVAICSSETQHLNVIKRYVENAWILCMREWRRLPSIVSHIHLPLLQAAQQVMELQEAAHGRAGTFQDMKAIVKNWFNRLPVISDDLSHWSDIFTWRQHHYTHIATHYEDQDQTGNARKLGVQSSAQALIHFGKIARKHGLAGVCLNTLSHLRLHSVEEPRLIDCFQEVRQQVKCYVHKATLMGRGELQKGLEIIDSNLMYFKKEMCAELFAYKGTLLAQLGRSEEANEALSASVQLHEQLVKGWGFWGEYFEKLFTRDPSNISLGQSAVICLLYACRLKNESKARKYLAKVLWLLTYDDSKSTLTAALHKYEVGIPALHWLPWIPQLLTCLVENKDEYIFKLLIRVGRMFPQAVYLQTRTMFSTLKIEQQIENRYLTAEMQANINKQGTGGSSDSPGSNPGSTGYVLQTPQDIPATESMKWCTSFLNELGTVHPTVLSSVEGIVEGIVDQLVRFRETWCEEVLRQLRQGLAKCQTIAFENRGAVAEATITQHVLNFLKKVVDNFGVGIDLKAQQSLSNGASESLANRAQTTVQDHEFESMKLHFTNDFDFSKPDATKLHNCIQKLWKWINILDAKVKTLPKSFLIENKCRFLSNFSLQTAETRGSQASIQVLREILQKVQSTTVPRTVLRDWAIRTFPGASDYWTFRKMFTLQLALACFSEYVFHLSRMNPDMMYLHQDSGLMNISYFKFDVMDDAGNLDSSRPVPFRLTPNIVEFISMIGVSGPLTSSMIAVARCLVQPNYKKPDCQQEPNSNPAEDKDLLINMVTRAASTIMTRLNSLANFDGVESKVSALVAAAMDPNNLCRMDPAWHPWLILKSEKAELLYLNWKIYIKTLHDEYCVKLSCVFVFTSIQFYVMTMMLAL
ncbi:Transcription-associated protein 1, partial [Gryllus bimaculatus]